jgi:hypothetical protein
MGDGTGAAAGQLGEFARPGPLSSGGPPGEGGRGCGLSPPARDFPSGATAQRATTIPIHPTSRRSGGGA